MAAATSKTPPETNLRGLRDHWRNDLIAGFSVALVALPLALGIATAAGAPPISGVVSVVVAGLLTTFLRGSHVAINGPGNSLVVIVAAGFATLGGEGAFGHVLGAIVVAGGVQVVIGLLRVGKLGDMIPPAVIQGMLAAIGLIIIGKQSHVLFGHTAQSSSPIAVFQELPQTLANLYPAAALIGVLSVLILAVHPRLKAKVVHFIPAPLWVIIITVPIGIAIKSFAPQITAQLGDGLTLRPDAFVSIPNDLLGSLARPDFSRIGEPGFWTVVLTLSLVTSIENVVSVKAVDKLDSYRRRSNLNRDLIAVGLSSIASGMLGGLPVLTVVARSSVNVNHGAKTGWSNMFQGLLLGVCVLFLSPLIEEIALAALAGVLVYTGYKLAAPHVVADTLRKGPDHFIVFGLTVVSTLVWGLLWGLLLGLAAELLSHLLIMGLAPRDAFRRIRHTRFETKAEGPTKLLLRVHGVASFLNIPRLRKALEALEPDKNLIMDFASATLVDNGLLEHCHDFGRRYEQSSRQASFEMIGLEAHRAISDHPDALHAKERAKQHRRLTPRQKQIAESARQQGWTFDPRREWTPKGLEDFTFFRVHPVEYRDSVVRGHYLYESYEVPFTLADVTFDEGALIPEVYHTTAQVIRLPVHMPELILEKEELLDRALELAGFEDIDFKHFTKFSKRFVLKGSDEEAIRSFMTPPLLEFFEREKIYHLESNGDRLVVFKTFQRRATPSEIEQMLGFSERLLRVLMQELEMRSSFIPELHGATSSGEIPAPDADVLAAEAD